MTGTAERLRHLAAAHTSGALASDDFLSRVCAVTAERLACNRASIWHFESDGASRWLRCLAMHDEQPAESIVGDTLAQHEYRDCFAALGAEGVFQSDDAQADPSLAGMRERYLAPLNVRSVLYVVFNVNGRSFGMLCCEQVGTPRAWRPHDVAELRRIGTVVSLALAGARAGPAWQATQPSELSAPR